MWITTIDRYILRYFFKAFFVLILVFLGISLAGIYIDQFKTLSNLTFLHAIFRLLIQLPQFIQTLLPLSILMATMMSFWNLIRHSELIPMRATGQSVWRLFRPLFLASLLIGIVSISALNPISVACTKKFQTLTEGKSDIVKTFDLKTGGFWLKEKGEKDTLILYAKKIKQENETLYFEDLTVFLMSFDHIFESRFDATKGSLSNQIFSFENITWFSPGEALKNEDIFTRPTKLSLVKIQETLSENETISFWQLPSLIQFLKKTGMNTQRQIALFYSFLFFPFLLSVFALLGLSFSISKHIRNTRFFIRIALGIVAGFVFFFVDKITFAMTSIGTLPLILGLTGCSLIVLFLTLGFLIHKEDS